MSKNTSGGQRQRLAVTHLFQQGTDQERGGCRHLQGRHLTAGARDLHAQPGPCLTLFEDAGRLTGDQGFARGRDGRIE